MVPSGAIVRLHFQVCRKGSLLRCIEISGGNGNSYLSPLSHKPQAAPVLERAHAPE